MASRIYTTLTDVTVVPDPLHEPSLVFQKGLAQGFHIRLVCLTMQEKKYR